MLKRYAVLVSFFLLGGLSSEAFAISVKEVQEGMMLCFKDNVEPDLIHSGIVRRINAPEGIIYLLAPGFNELVEIHSDRLFLPPEGIPSVVTRVVRREPRVYSPSPLRGIVEASQENLSGSTHIRRSRSLSNIPSHEDLSEPCEEEQEGEEQRAAFDEVREESTDDDASRASSSSSTASLPSQGSSRLGNLLSLITRRTRSSSPSSSRRPALSKVFSLVAGSSSFN